MDNHVLDIAPDDEAGTCVGRILQVGLQCRLLAALLAPVVAVAAVARIVAGTSVAGDRLPRQAELAQCRWREGCSSGSAPSGPARLRCDSKRPADARQTPVRRGRRGHWLPTAPNIVRRSETHHRVDDRASSQRRSSEESE